MRPRARGGRARPALPVRDVAGSPDRVQAPTDAARPLRRPGTACPTWPAHSPRAGTESRCAPTPPQPVETAQLRRRLYVLPRKEKPHEVGGADRLDLRAEPVDGVAMNPRQQGA